MKEGWKYKKIGAVCDIYQPKTISKKDFVDNGEYSVYGANGIIGSYDHYNHKESVVLLGCRGSVGTVTISKPYSWINGNAMVICPRSSDMLPTFLAYQLKNIDLSKVITGIAQPQITRQSLAPIMIAIPSLTEQQHIVKELDLLNFIIEKKRNQLNELDKLAQSFFYELFGNPFTNEKKWEVKELKSICSKITDGTHDTPQRLDKGVKFITGKHIRPFSVDYDNSDYVTEEVHKEIFLRCNPEMGDVLYTNIGAGIGNAAINTVDYEFSMKNVALLKLHKKIVNGYYMEFYLNNDLIKTSIVENFSNGGAQKFLSLKSIAKIPVPVPPLALQTQFVEKVLAIDHQKNIIKKTIKEEDNLFKSRMDYWFN